MSESEHRFVSFDKTVIFYRCFEPTGVRRATLILLHGFGEHSGRYRELAEFLAQGGVATFAPDLRGFGHSGGGRGALRDYSDYFKDLEAVHRLAAAASGPAPLFILGHSYGGLLAASWVASFPELRCCGLMLSSPNCGIAIHVARWRHWLAFLLSYVLPGYTENNGVDDSKVTHDPQIVAAARKDPLMHHRISVRLYREMCRSIDGAGRTAKAIRCPALIIQGGNDHVVLRDKTVLFFEQLGSEDKELKIYEGLYHEVLNEVERPAIFARLRSWMEQRF